MATVGYLVTVGFGRALVGETFLSTYSAADHRVRRALVPDMIGASVVVSLVAAAVVGVGGTIAGGAAGSALVALAIVLPLLLVQDTWRYRVHRRPPGRRAHGRRGVAGGGLRGAPSRTHRRRRRLVRRRRRASPAASACRPASP